MQGSGEIYSASIASFRDWRSIESLLAAGLTFEQALRLVQLRARHRAEVAQARQQIDRRLEFARWLVARGRLSDFF
jgi:hypothetical protein